MGFPAIQRVRTGDVVLEQIQDALARGLKPVLDLPLFPGVLLEGVSLASGANSINHGLGRAPRLWFIVRLSSNITVWEVASETTDLILSLHASGAGTVSVWVA